MKKAIAISFVLIFCLQNSLQFLIYIQFKLDQNRIERLYCINKDRTELACKGKCYLMQKLQAAADQHIPDAPVIVQTLELHWCPPALKSKIHLAEESLGQLDFHYTSSQGRMLEQSIFHPPTLI